MPLIQLNKVSHTFSDQPLFHSLSISISSRTRLGIIGPNGAGKSTLVQILSGMLSPDEGQRTCQKGIRIAYVEQESHFPEKDTAEQVFIDYAQAQGCSEGLCAAAMKTFPSSLLKTPTGQLSGGMKKRLAICSRLMHEPDIVFFDEPTNHLDQDGIEWLENLLRRAPFAWVVISHDRELLNQVPEEILEISPAYPNGSMLVNGQYQQYLQQKEDYRQRLASEQQSLKTKVKREKEWLEQGIKARGTRSQSRVERAIELQEQLHANKALSKHRSVQIDFQSTSRQSKQLLELKNISVAFDEKPLFRQVNMTLTRGSRWAILGGNGVGKSTLLKIIAGEFTAYTGQRHALPELNIVYFDQLRSELDQSQTVKSTLTDGSDQVIYQERSIHVASWAKRFGFANKQLDTLVGRLSGGERARLLIAKLILTPADILLLDEPSNDLDIGTLEVLEEALREFPGALILISHDRFLVKKVCQQFIGLSTKAEHKIGSSPEQCHFAAPRGSKDKASQTKKISSPQKQTTKLSYHELKEYKKIPQHLEKLEKETTALEEQLTDPKILSDHELLQELTEKIGNKKTHINELYERWDELEAKASPQQKAE